MGYKLLRGWPDWIDKRMLILDGLGVIRIFARVAVIRLCARVAVIRLCAVLGIEQVCNTAIRIKHWQLAQRLKSQVVQELTGSSKQCRSTKYFLVADCLDPPAIFECLDDLTRHRHATNCFDIPTGNRLPVGNDSQRLHHRS